VQAVFNYKPVAGICIAVCLNLLLSVDALAKDDAGKVLRVTGRATVTTQQGEIQQIGKGTKLQATDIISTSARSYVRMKMEDRSYIMVRPDSRMVIDEFKFNKKKPVENKGFFSLLKGGFRAVTGLIEDKKKYRYRTAVATIGIRGTDFSLRICNADCYDVDPVPKNGLFLHMHSKESTVYTKAGAYNFKQGQFAYVANSNAPAVLLDGMPEVFAQSPIPSPVPDCKQ
jgi:hypothetical protein